MRLFISSLGLTVCIILSSINLCYSQTKIDTVTYRQGVERAQISRTLSYVERIKRKGIDSINVYLYTGDELRITAKSKRPVSMILADSTNKTILASSIASEPSRFTFKAKNRGLYTFTFSNASMFFASKIDVQLNQTHTHSRCTIECVEFATQERVSALPEKIETTVSYKQPKEFSIALARLDTLTLFIPGGAKIPRLDITNRKNQRLYTLESKRGPLTLNLAVFDSGLVKIRLSKTGILGRIPTDHTLFLGKITPRQTNTACCNAFRLVEKRPVAQVVDTLMQVRLDTVISLTAMRDITNKPFYPIDIAAFKADSSLVKRFLLIDRTNNDTLITNSLIGLKERLLSSYNEKLSSTILGRLAEKNSLTKISFETALQKLEIPNQLAILDITDLTDINNPFVSHTNKIQSMVFRLIIVDFNYRYTLVYPDR